MAVPRVCALGWGRTPATPHLPWLVSPLNFCGIRFLLTHPCWRGCGETACHHREPCTPHRVTRGRTALGAHPPKTMPLGKEAPTEMQLGDLLCRAFPGCGAFGSCPRRSPANSCYLESQRHSLYLYLQRADYSGRELPLPKLLQENRRHMRWL